jgi:hypothetical protein
MKPPTDILTFRIFIFWRYQAEGITNMDTAELLRVCRDRLSYDPLNGVLTWIKPVAKRIKVGDSVTGVSGDGSIHTTITINGKHKFFKAHQLAWLMTTGHLPVKHIDHINGVKTDNRWCNLREATISECLCNTGKRKDNTSTFKGVTFWPKRNKFKAQITLNGKYHYLGIFRTAEEAYAAYCKAAKALHGEFANHG